MALEGDVIEGGGTQSLDRAIGLLRSVAGKAGQGIRLNEITRFSGLTKPTAHRLLRALERHGLIEQDAESELFHLGPESFILGVLAAERYSVYRLAGPSITRLAQASGDVAFLTAKRGWHGVCLHREEGDFPVRSHALAAGDRHPLGIGAGSLAILAALPDEQLDEALRANSAELEGYPSYSPELLREEVVITRAQGFALNKGRLVAGSWGVGVPIRNERGECEAALSIAAIEPRLGPERRLELAQLLHEEAAALELALAQRRAGHGDRRAAAQN